MSLAINQNQRNTVLIQIMLLGLLILVLQLPIAQIIWLISDRKETKETARSSISRLVGGEQTIEGPILTIPYLKRNATNTPGTSPSESRAVLHVLPELLSIHGVTETETHYRGIFEIPTYVTKLTIEGKFSLSEVGGLDILKTDLLLKEASLAVGITDPRAIRDQVSLAWDEAQLSFKPGPASASFLGSGISSPVTLMENDKQEYTFSFVLPLGGSSSLHFVPLGRKTVVELHANWPDPSFSGAYLPTARTVTTDGFEAQWSIPDLGRGFGQLITGSSDPRAILTSSKFGVELITPVDGHRMTERAIKYEILFIFLTFLSFYLFEIFFGLRVHPIQYLLVGGALCLFYLLLLALSEHLGFALAYILSSATVVFLVAGYSKSVLRGTRRSTIILSIMSTLYSFLFVLLAAQDYSLLIGSLGLTLVLATVMYLTRNVNWYAVAIREPQAGGE